MIRSITRLVASASFVFAMGLVGCDSGNDTGPDENADAEGTAETGNSGESGESGGTESADTDPDCPAGSFDCPCDNGMCAEGLTCGPDNLCALGGSETGNPTTTGETATSASTGSGSANAYDPENCEAPSEILGVEQIEGEFCATPCTPETQEDDCPGGPAGTNASCSISTVGGVPNFCTLICVPDSESCPMGSTCKAIPQQPNTGICTYP